MPKKREAKTRQWMNYEEGIKCFRSVISNNVQKAENILSGDSPRTSRVFARLGRSCDLEKKKKRVGLEPFYSTAECWFEAYLQNLSAFSSFLVQVISFLETSLGFQDYTYRTDVLRAVMCAKILMVKERTSAKLRRNDDAWCFAQSIVGHFPLTQIVLWNLQTNAMEFVRSFV